MVLQVCPNESGQCADENCATPQAWSHQWQHQIKSDRTTDKICRTCFRTKEAAARKAVKRAAQDSPTPSSASKVKSAGDTLVKIIKIYGYRYARPPSSPRARPAMIHRLGLELDSAST